MILRKDLRPAIPETYIANDMTPKEVLREWIDCFNAADASRIVELYADDAVNHQVANEPIAGKAALYEMFANEFATAEMVCSW